ncbi:MAG: hypothetical protein LUP99_00095, partial [Methanomicrobiales archaeon]|nr:hypothetical protein [Methanomicrobiales archaeon]
RFYVWTWEELERVLNPIDLLEISRVFSLKKEGNLPIGVLEHLPKGNIFYRTEEWQEIGKDKGISPVEMQQKIEKVLPVLFQVRSSRVRPRKDTKILADWNGLMVAALAYGGRVLGDTEYTAAAERAADFVMTRMQKSDGRLHHVYATETAYIDAFTEDYAAMAWGEIELYQTTFQPIHLKRAISLMDQLNQWYWDKERGGYYLTASDGEALIAHKKEVYDGAIPSGNSLAMYALLRLARLTGIIEYEDRAIRLWRALSGQLDEIPQGSTFLQLATDYFFGPAQEVVIVGDPASPDTREMVQEIRTSFHPHMTVHLLSGGESDVELKEIVPSTRAYAPPGQKMAVYICSGDRCLGPTAEIETVRAYLSLHPNNIK